MPYKLDLTDFPTCNGHLEGYVSLDRFFQAPYHPAHANHRGIYITRPQYLSDNSASGFLDLAFVRFISIVSPHFLQLPEKNFLIRLS